MATVKIGVRGDGQGALYTYEHSPPPTYGEIVTIDGVEYRVESVERFHSNRRADVVQVDVERVSEDRRVKPPTPTS